MNRTKYLRGECTACGGQIEYPADMVGTAIPCPHCGKTTDLFLEAPPQEPAVPRRMIVWGIIAAFILIAGLVASMIALNRARDLAERNRTQPPAQTQPR